jgi:hypothetical protein
MLAWLLLAVVVALRLASPAGWMPVVGVDGVRVELCTETGGPRTLIIDSEGKSHPDVPAPAHDPCPFALAGAAPLDLTAVAALPLAPAMLAALVAPAITAARLVAWRATRPPARGPPSLV